MNVNQKIIFYLFFRVTALKLVQIYLRFILSNLHMSIELFKKTYKSIKKDNSELFQAVNKQREKTDKKQGSSPMLPTKS